MLIQSWLLRAGVYNIQVKLNEELILEKSVFFPIFIL